MDDRLIRRFIDAIKTERKKPQPYDTKATVKRVDGNTAFVQYAGTDTETPVQIGISVKDGDNVIVRNSGGRAYIFGNTTEPPTGDMLARQADQKASELDRKMGKFTDELSEADKIAREAQRQANINAQEMAQQVIRINGDIEDLQEQIDGNITSWFYEVDPTLQNEPASEWIAQHDEANHVGDLYYNVDSGHTWRWVYLNNAYQWTPVQDSDVARALQLASEAKDTADQKRRVFVTTPTPPYDVGDIWLQGSAGDLYRCTQAKIESQSYSASDWVLGTKYTDDTRADEAYTLAGQAKTSADGKSKVYHQSTQPTGGTYQAGDTWFNTSDGYKMYTYNGSSWVLEQFGESALADLSVTNAKIANATIQSGKISGLDVGKLTGGYIDASHINANMITIGQSQVTGLTNALSGKANTSDIPTAVSDLTNDTGFITSSALPTDLSDLNNDEGFITSEDVPTKVSELTNDSGYATTTQVATAKSEAISTASSDATSKANTAESNAISTASADATSKANTAQANAIATASADATTKANAAAKTATDYLSIATGGVYVHDSTTPADYTDSDANGVLITDDIDIIRSGSSVAEFGSSGARIGQSNRTHSVLNANGIWFYDDTGITPIAYFSYLAGAPFFTFGTRQSGTMVGRYSFAEGDNVVASGITSHAEGFGTQATGHYSHTEGYNTKADGYYSHAQNNGTVASKDSQTVIGEFNIEDTENSHSKIKAFIIGNGTDDNNRSNALTVDWDGNINVSGDITVKNHASHIGDTVVGTETTKTGSNAGSGSWITGSSISLTAGVWVVTAHVQFNANTSGRRAIQIYAGSDAIEQSLCNQTPTTGSSTLTHMTTSHVLSLSTTSTVTIRSYQTSGGNLQVVSHIRAVRIR